MKIRTALLLLASAAVFAIAGCTAPQLVAADKAVGGTPLPVVTLPTTQPGVYATTQPGTGLLTIHLIGDAANAAAPIVNTYAPAPIGGIVAGALGIIAAVAGGIISNKNKSRAQQAEGVIAAAAAPVANLVQQATGSVAAGQAVTGVAGLAPGIIALLNHPAATAATGGASAVAASIPAAPAVVVPKA